jgi:hypothetical protein
MASRILRSIAWIWHLFLARVREIPISGGVSGSDSSPAGAGKWRPLFSVDVSGESPSVGGVSNIGFIGHQEFLKYL